LCISHIEEFPFVSPEEGLPRSPRNIMRDSLHPILKGMGRESAGFHTFRRLRESILQMSKVRTLCSSVIGWDTRTEKCRGVTANSCSTTFSGGESVPPRWVLVLSFPPTGPGSRSRLNLVVARLTVPNIESRRISEPFALSGCTQSCTQTSPPIFHLRTPPEREDRRSPAKEESSSPGSHRIGFYSRLRTFVSPVPSN